VETEVETNLTFLKDSTPDDSPFENLEEGDPISPLEYNIGDYFQIEKEKWEVVGPQFDCAPIYDTDKEDEVESGPPFLSSIIYEDISIDTLGKENYHFPLHENEQLEMIDSPFWEDLIFDTNNHRIDKALAHTYIS